MERKNILGLSIGTQLMGLAYVKDGVLHEWEVKNFDGKWSKMKLRIILLSIERYIDLNEIHAIGMKVPETSNSSSAVELLIKDVLKLCDRKNVPVKCCTITELKTRCGVTNREELIQYSLALFPELSKDFAKSRSVKKVYYVKTFEAVLVTLL